MSKEIPELESPNAETCDATSESIKADLVKVDDYPEPQMGDYTLDLPQPETEPNEPQEVIPPKVMKGTALTLATMGVLGVHGLAHPQKVGEVTLPAEPAPTVQEIDPIESTIELVEVNQKEDTSEATADLQEQTVVEKERQAPNKIESHIETAPMEQQWWMDVPLQSQQGLKYGDNATQYGCTPTATSMILDYWHTQDPNNETTSAQELLDINAEQGEFSATGMSATNIHDEVRRLGYGVVEDRLGSNLDDLKQAVDQGPVIGIVKLNMKTSGENHAVVVTGISEDNQVRVNDPWTGEAHTFSWDEFSQSWGADFGKNFTRNNFVTIRPL